MIATLGAIALGGALGAVSRHFVNIVAGHAFGLDFPWGTVIVNIVGSFLMGMLITVFAKFGQGAPELRSFVLTGFLGALTTFSTFSLDFVTLFERQDYFSAFAYLAASVICSIGALFLALWMMRGLLA